MNSSTSLWRARVILEDGSIWPATSFGAEGEAKGEVVFNTAMSGYQEILSDPSYHGQVVVMTYPEIGNYGVNDEDLEAAGVKAAGLLVRNASRVASNWRATSTLAQWLKRSGVVALEGIDTRALTRRIREKGAMKIFMTTETVSDSVLRERLAEVEDLVGADFVQHVTRAKSEPAAEGWSPTFRPRLLRESKWAAPNVRRPRVVAFDFGAKSNIFKCLVDAGFEVIVVPARTNAAAVTALDPEGVFLSNGPGDPRPLDYATETVRALLGKLPIFGICLGHQILGQAIGAEVVKLKFGHHGANHPVLNLDTRAVEITAQNHGFAVTPESIAAAGARVTHLNLNDRTVEGMEVPGRMAFSVQYHPEASPGPHDSLYLFTRFREMVEQRAVAGLVR